DYYCQVWDSSRKFLF
nr:immunoglobulin light chain junction region [Macaca mulatta]